jgi:hypothetical protein
MLKVILRPQEPPTSSPITLILLAFNAVLTASMFFVPIVGPVLFSNLNMLAPPAILAESLVSLPVISRTALAKAGTAVSANLHGGKSWGAMAEFGSII